MPLSPIDALRRRLVRPDLQPGKAGEGETVMTTQPTNGAGMYRNILMAVLTALFAAVIASYFAQAGQLDTVAKDTAEARNIAGQALAATGRIEARLKTMDDASTISAAEERDRLKAEVLELQQSEKRRD